jgi:hypothetical protein
LIRAAFRGSSIFERHSLWRFAARVNRSHCRTHARRDTNARGDDHRAYGDDHGAIDGMSIRHRQHSPALHLSTETPVDEREALLMLLDFLLGSSIDDIATARRVESRGFVEDALRRTLLKYGFTAKQGPES